MAYKILWTEEFKKDFNKLPKPIQEEIKKLRDKIKENPFVGDPLGYKFLREKKLKGLRLYFLIYEDIVLVLFIGISDKKTQQATIDEIKMRLTDYYMDVHKNLKERF